MCEHAVDQLNTALEESSVYSFHLLLLSDAEDACELWLPKTAEGVLTFSGEARYRFLNITAKNGQWMAVCKKPAFFKDVSTSNSHEMPLRDGMAISVCLEERTYLLLAARASSQHSVFHNYSVSGDCRLMIGSGPDCQIRYNGPGMTDQYACITRAGGQWRISCLEGPYGVYINQVQAFHQDLQLGDVVLLMGLKIIAGPGFLSINSGFGSLAVDTYTLQPTAQMNNSYTRYYEQDAEETGERYFNRAPRKRRETAIKPIAVEGPPMSMNQKKIPMMLRMGSSMVMGGAAALAGNFMTLISSVLFPFMSSRYTEKQQQEYEKLRVSKYTEYLDKKRAEIQEAIDVEREDLSQKHPMLCQLVQPERLSGKLWERRPNDSDFLQLRLGTGTRPLTTPIDYPPRSFELEPDELEEQMYQLVEHPYTVENAPIVLSLTETYICGLQGEKRRILDFLYELVIQLAVLHSYDEVKTVFLMDRQSLERLDAVRYLPHSWDDQRTIRLVATNEAEAYAVGEYIKNQIENEIEEQNELPKILKKRPYYIVFALEQKLFDGHEIFKQILQTDKNPGASVVTAYDALPKESQKIITLETDRKNICTTMGIDGGEDELFALTPITSEQAQQTLRLLANTSLKKINQGQSMPKMVSFLEMFRVGRIEQLNPLKRWQESNPAKTLTTPVGVGEDGAAFMLDLHEKRQGPHGLVAGMTGSGKSEFLITYILSMAVNYHPDEVAFVLIDYKGGGLVDAFENPRIGVRLPHLAGTITNLDGGAIQRSLMSIESELIRRQKLFSQVSKLVNEGSMNIYSYQKLYRAGVVKEPIPHLFIISDEFAELKQQQPEFMEKLISAARIGRSLGVHLILATQKPSGVVNDQIRSNTKFRACLRVQEKSDSMDMLKRPEAAELTDTGRFYLQVGYNEYFAMGQSAWCGAPYEPQDVVSVQRDDAVEFLDMTGQVTAKSKPKIRKSDSGMSQIVAVVQHLSALAEKQGISVRRLWIDPLPKLLDCNQIPSCDVADTVSAVLGMIDDPRTQSQYPFVAKLQEYNGLLIVGNSGSGKTTLLRTMLYSLSTQYTSEQVNYYIMDFSGGTLSAFRDAPHCGACLTENDEQAIDRLMQMLRGMIKERKQLFRQAGVASYEAYRAIRQLPLVFVMIDNAFGMTSLGKGNSYFSSMHEYVKDAAPLGIRFVITCNNLNEVSTRVRQEINTRIALQLKDKYAYADVLGGRAGGVPQPFSGRGMCIREGVMLEFHTAIPFAENDDVQRGERLAALMVQIAENSKYLTPAARLPVIDPEETYEAFCGNIPTGRIPLGYDLQNVKRVSIPFAQLFTAAVYFGQERAAATILNNLAMAARKNGMELLLVKRDGKSILDNCDWCEGLKVFKNTQQSSVELCYRLIDEIKQRKVFRNEYCARNGIAPEQAKLPDSVKKASGYIRRHTRPLMIVFEDFLEFSQNLEESCFKIYQDIFQNGRGYNVYFFGCFYPNSTAAANDLLTKEFIDTALVLLFGGQLQKQSLVTLPMELRKGGIPEMTYNQFIMRYNDGFYPMVMPCIPPREEDIDPDDRPII